MRVAISVTTKVNARDVRYVFLIQGKNEDENIKHIKVESLPRK